MASNLTENSTTGVESSLRKLLRAGEHGSMTDSVTDALREGVLSGTLSPGEWLREDDLAETLGVSRTPVREALRRLSDEGLTERIPNRGTVVASMTMEDILGVYEVRATLEGLAARLAASSATDAQIEKLRQLQDEMRAATESGRPLSEINLDFHRVIRQSARNALLAKFLVQVEHAVRRFGETTFQWSGRPLIAIAEHDAIVDAIAAHDADAAEQAAYLHMRNAREIRVRQFLER